MINNTKHNIHNQAAFLEKIPLNVVSLVDRDTTIARLIKASQSCLFALLDGVTGHTCFEPTFSTVIVPTNLNGFGFHSF